MTSTINANPYKHQLSTSKIKVGDKLEFSICFLILMVAIYMKLIGFYCQTADLIKYFGFQATTPAPR